MYEIPIQYIRSLADQYDALSLLMDTHTIGFNNALYAMIKKKYSIIHNPSATADQDTTTHSSDNIAPPNTNTNESVEQTNTTASVNDHDTSNAHSSDEEPVLTENKSPADPGEQTQNNASPPLDEEPNIDNTCPPSSERCGETSKTVFTFYEPPELIFTTRKKYIRKLYKKIIVKIHPDKIKSTDDILLYSKYFETCRGSIEKHKIHPMWIIADDLDINIKLKSDVKKAITLEINALKKFNESIMNSVVYKWTQATDPSIKTNYVFQYISAFI